MASIPCATYQASHVHAQMRQSQRNRHSSTTSTDSATSDGTPLAPPAPLTAPPVSLTPAMQQASQVTVRDRMDRVSQWIRKLYNNPIATPYSSIPEHASIKSPDSSITNVSVTSQGSMVNSET